MNKFILCFPLLWCLRQVENMDLIFFSSITLIHAGGVVEGRIVQVVGGEKICCAEVKIFSSFNFAYHRVSTCFMPLKFLCFVGYVVTFCIFCKLGQAWTLKLKIWQLLHHGVFAPLENLKMLLSGDLGFCMSWKSEDAIEWRFAFFFFLHHAVDTSYEITMNLLKSRILQTKDERKIYVNYFFKNFLTIFQNVIVH